MISKPDYTSEYEYFIKNNKFWAPHQETFTSHENQQF